MGLANWLTIVRILLVPVLVAFPFFYALSPYAWLITEPRYLILLGPPLALVVVAAGGTAGRSV